MTKSFAVVRAGVVVNVIMISPGDTVTLPQGDQLVEATERTEIGGTYAGGQFALPARQPQPQPVRFRITPAEFIDRMTNAQLDWFIAHGTSGPAAAKRFYVKLLAATELDVTAARANAIMDYLIAQSGGVFTEADRAPMLATVDG